MNKGGALFIPDFTDIHDDVQSVNYKSRLNLSAELIFHIGKICSLCSILYALHYEIPN